MNPAAFLTPDAIHELTLIATANPDKAAKARGDAWHRERVAQFKLGGGGL